VLSFAADALSPLDCATPKVSPSYFFNFERKAIVLGNIREEKLCNETINLPKGALDYGHYG
jgi:hypothetical protein